MIHDHEWNLPTKLTHRMLGNVQEQKWLPSWRTITAGVYKISTWLQQGLHQVIQSFLHIMCYTGCHHLHSSGHTNVSRLQSLPLSDNFNELIICAGRSMSIASFCSCSADDLMDYLAQQYPYSVPLQAHSFQSRQTHKHTLLCLQSDRDTQCTTENEFLVLIVIFLDLGLSPYWTLAYQRSLCFLFYCHSAIVVILGRWLHYEPLTLLTVDLRDSLIPDFFIINSFICLLWLDWMTLTILTSQTFWPTNHNTVVTVIVSWR